MNRIYIVLAVVLISLFILNTCKPTMNNLDDIEIPQIRVTPPDSVASPEVRALPPASVLPSFTYNPDCWSFMEIRELIAYIIEQTILAVESIDGLTTEINNSFTDLVNNKGAVLPYDSDTRAIIFSSPSQDQYVVEAYNYAGTLGSLIFRFEWMLNTQSDPMGKVLYSFTNDPTETHPNFDVVRVDFDFSVEPKLLTITIKPRLDSFSYLDESKIVMKKSLSGAFYGSGWFVGIDQSCFPEQGINATPDIKTFFYADDGGGAAKAVYNNVVIPVDYDDDFLPNGYLTSLIGKEYFDYDGTTDWIDIDLDSTELTLEIQDTLMNLSSALSKLKLTWISNIPAMQLSSQRVFIKRKLMPELI